MVSSSVVRLAGFGWQAEVLPAYGMNLIRLARSGSELLRTPEGETQLRREPQVYGMPLLLPPNRTAGGAFTFRAPRIICPSMSRCTATTSTAVWPGCRSG